MKKSEMTREDLVFEIKQLTDASKRERQLFASYRKRIYATIFKDRILSVRLTDNEIKAFNMTWGFEGHEPTSNKEVAKEMNLHPVRISQLTQGFLKKMFKEDKQKEVPPVEINGSDEMKKIYSSGPKTLDNLVPGDLLVTQGATILRVLSASGEGEFRFYGVSYQAKELDSDDLKRFSDYFTAFELKEKGYTILS